MLVGGRGGVILVFTNLPVIFKGEAATRNLSYFFWKMLGVVNLKVRGQFVYIFKYLEVNLG